MCNFIVNPNLQKQNESDYMTIGRLFQGNTELPIKSSCMSLLFCNVRSVINKLSRFQELVSEMNWEFDIIGITETWISRNNYDLFSLPNCHEPSQNIELTRKGVFIIRKRQYSVKHHARHTYGARFH